MMKHFGTELSELLKELSAAIMKQEEIEKQKFCLYPCTPSCICLKLLTENQMKLMTFLAT